MASLRADFRAWADSSAVEVLVQARAVVAGITTGEVWFDSLTWRRIYRYVLWSRGWWMMLRPWWTWVRAMCGSVRRAWVRRLRDRERGWLGR